MVEFRKVFLTLAGMVVATGLASAQVNPLQCVATSGNPPPVRSEGIAEEVGQVVITCTGGKSVAAGLPIPTINVQVFLNTNLTSRLLASGARSEALLLIDEPAPAEQFEALAVPNVQQFTGNGDGTYKNLVTDTTLPSFHPTIFAAQQSGTNSVTWLNVPFDPPGTTGNRVLRLVNVRANASMLPTPVLSGISPVSMFISISGAILPINNSQLTVAYAQKGMVFKGYKDDSNDYTKLSINQCEPGDRIIVSQFVEQFATAWRTVPTSPAFGQPVPPQNTFNVSYNTESMFTTGLSGISAGAGVATQATHLLMRFTNIPAGVTLKVPTSITSDTSTQLNDLAVLVSADGSTTDPGTGEVTLTGGSGVAVWEIQRANTGSINALNVNVHVITKSSTVPGLGSGTISGNYSPISTTMTASGGAAPRFVDTATTGNTITFNSCRTNLLFPFVTNQANFDTGIVISNTSADPFGTTTQSGTCTLNYYSATNAPAAQTSSAIAAGDQLIFTASAGNSAQLIAPTPAFQGYIIATCNFQYAHGYAFISTPTQGGLSNGYLALVLDSAKGSRTGATSEPLNN